MLMAYSVPSSQENTGETPQERPFCSMSSENWKGWVTEQRQEYSQRLKSARHTRENECLSWPTISVNESKNLEGGSQAARNSPPLGTMVHLASGPQDPASLSTGGSQAAPSAGKLSPRWVETLMGLPIGWTMPSCLNPATPESMNCDCSETESSRQPPSELGECFMKDSGVSQRLTPRVTEIASDPNFVARMGDRSEGCFASLSHQVRSAKDWPTIRASDAEHGGPNQRGSKGDLMLPSAELRTAQVPQDLCLPLEF
jgi:hypothetical protein